MKIKAPEGAFIKKFSFDGHLLTDCRTASVYNGVLSSEVYKVQRRALDVR